MKMSVRQVVLGLSAALVLSVSSARADDTVVGKVRGLYTELTRDIWMKGTRAGKPTWADVEFPTGAEPRRALVRVAGELGVEAGDLVEVRMAVRGAGAPLSRASETTQIAAKWFTPRAGEFDLATRRTASIF